MKTGEAGSGLRARMRMLGALWPQTVTTKKIVIVADPISTDPISTIADPDGHLWEIAWNPFTDLT